MFDRVGGAWFFERLVNTFYADVAGELVVLSLDADRIGSEVRWETPSPAPPPGSTVTEFPHVYGPIDLAAVVGLRRLQRDASGRFASFAPYEPRA